MNTQTKTDLEATKQKTAETWEENFYVVYGYTPSYEDTPKQYRKYLWSSL
ncbi:MAG: hypothetical protein ACTSQE_17060 [Candidatus Heimdallarchaeaceae archaeon]